MNKGEENPVMLITGGSGFLGQFMVKELLDPSSPLQPKEIRVFDLKPFPSALPDKVSFINGDVTDLVSLSKAMAGVDVVIHSAAIIDWGVKDDSEVMRINVGGTENVIKACKENGTPNLILTSSLDSVYTGSPLVDIDEAQPYPTSFATSYCKSKTLAEQLVKAANSHLLKTCILRPADIYGEGDPYHIDPLIEMAKSGFYVRLGNGQARCQHVYAGNMAYAHVLAAGALLNNNKAVEGNAYFITDSQSSNFFTFFDQVVLNAGYRIRPKNLWIPKGLAYLIASFAELGVWLIRPFKKVDLKFSRFAVSYTCNDFTFTADSAKRDFGFLPKYSVEEAMKRTARYYQKKEKN
jgi:nucleoside-diphosphate-sugar epimerase